MLECRYALKQHEVKTLLGHLVKAEIVTPHAVQAQAQDDDAAAAAPGDGPGEQRFVLTGRKVILKYYEKAKLTDHAFSREDPFKEIASLQYLSQLPRFPTVLDVMEQHDCFVKVETDCGRSLLHMIMARPDL